MELREPDAEDADRVREVVDSAMTTSFRLSPEQIEVIASAQFSDDALAEDLEADDAIVRVAEADVDGGEETIVGVVEGRVDEESGDLRWLFVDPEHRGRGIGTELFEEGRDALHERGAADVRVELLEANTEGHGFVERFGYEQVGERRAEFADRELAEHVYAPGDADVDVRRDDQGDPDADADDDEQFPEATDEDGQLVATTSDGEEVYVARDEDESGTEAAFYVAYADDGFEAAYGYYCSNCGSLETAMNEMERIECSNCGNHHTSKSRRQYDDSYL